MASLGSVDGSNRAQTAKFLKTFPRSGSLSFGDTINRNEKVEWFTFRTIGNRFNRSSLVFAASADSAKVNVFFRPQNGSIGIGRRLRSLNLSDEPKSFTARLKDDGTYFIQVKRSRPGAMPYGIAFSMLGFGNSRAIASTRRAPTGRELFF